MDPGKRRGMQNVHLALLSRAGKNNPYLAHNPGSRGRGRGSGKAPVAAERAEPAPRERQNRALRFVPRGKYIEMANRMRQEQALDALKARVDAATREAGLEMDLVSAESVAMEPVPVVEWWDAELLRPGVAEGLRELPTTAQSALALLQLDPSAGTLVTQYVQHPVAVPPPTTEVDVRAEKMPVMLTPQERKRLRKQRRREMQQDKQDRIRLGLLPPEEPRLRIANLMRVLGAQAAADPTQLEAMARAQMEDRRRRGEEHNAARKLTPEQRSAKSASRYALPAGVETVHVAVFRAPDLQDARKRFKLRANALQLHCTGVAVVFEGANVIVVEGSRRAVEFYKRLVLHRINWAATGEAASNAQLVWEGEQPHAAFSDWTLRFCATEERARRIFQQASCEQYFNLCFLA